MHKRILGLACLFLALPLRADECVFDFGQMPTNHPPAGCFSIVGGTGKPGTWKVLRDSMPLALAPLDPGLAATAPQAVAGQLAWDATDNHYPMLVLGTNTYGDFTFSTRFKIVDGMLEQMAGVAFRMQDERNYYYVRADALKNTLCFSTVKDGQAEAPICNEITFRRGVWHQLRVECAGAKFNIFLDDARAFPELENAVFSAGKIALWTKSDSISYFTDTRIRYTPRQPFVQTIVRDIMKQYPHLLGLKVMMVPPQAKEPRLVASNDEKEIGGPGENIDLAVIQQGQNYFRKEKEVVYVTMPLRDRNGDAVAAVRFMMKSFRGQTEENALVRAMPILKSMQQRAAAVDRIY